MVVVKTYAPCSRYFRENRKIYGWSGEEAGGWKRRKEEQDSGSDSRIE
jgi:hypothetical protein